MNRIKELRKARKISQCKLAEMLNVHQTAISQWETGRTNPDIATAIFYYNILTEYCLLFLTNHQMWYKIIITLIIG